LLVVGHLRDPLLLSEITEKFCGIAGDNGVCGNILSDDATRTHDGVFANYDVAKNGGTRADGSAFLHHRSLDDPILFGLQLSVARHSTRIAVVDECDAVAHEDPVFDVHAFTYKGMTRDFAVLADFCVFLYLNECADFRVVPNLAAIEIDELRKLDVCSQSHVGRDTELLATRGMHRSVRRFVIGDFHFVQTRTRATLDQLGGRFFGISISSKMLLSREPWSLTHAAML